MIKIYKSRRDWVYGSLFLIISLFFIGIIVASYFDMLLLEWLTMAFVVLAINGFLLLSFFLVKIRIEGEELIVSVVFDIFRLSIYKITKIRIGETMWSGFHKCGTSVGGLIVFSKFKNDLYITPKNQDEFIKDLLAINRHIIIEDVRKNKG